MYIYEVKVFMKKFHGFDTWKFLADNSRHAAALAERWAKLQSVKIEIFTIRKIAA